MSDFSLTPAGTELPGQATQTARTEEKGEEEGIPARRCKDILSA